MSWVDDLKLEEYKFLRTEHENNRKFVFERPLVIVVGMLAASAGVKESPAADMLGLLPVLLLSMLWFNLWFTHNRMMSSARIVAYIQLVLEPRAQYRWSGWENALRDFREWTMTPNAATPIGNEAESDRSMQFYRPIFYFHLLCGALFVALTLMQFGAFDRLLVGSLDACDSVWVSINGIALCVFLVAAVPYRPKQITRAIATHRKKWEAVFTKERKRGGRNS